MKKRFMSLFVIFLMILQVFALSTPVAVFAIPLTWQDAGIPAADFAGGSGSVGDPYKIATEAQLAYLAQQVNAGNWYDGQYFALTNNLDLSGREWIPIGSPSGNYFRGNFDGRGHVIDGLSINSSSSDQGLFGNIASGRTVERLGLTNVNINAIDGTIWGALAAWNDGTISNSFVTGSLTFSGLWTLGGLVGINTDSGIIKNSYTNTAINGTVNVGGLVGLNYGSIINSFAVGTTAATTTNTIGGLVGMLNGGSVSKSYYTDYPRVLTGSGYSSGPIIDGEIPAGNPDVSGNDTNWKETLEANPFQATAFFTWADAWNAAAPWDFDTVWTTNGDTSYPELIPVAEQVASSDATVATVGSNYTVDNTANTIAADGTAITTSVTVGTFLGNLTKNAGASWKVVSSGTSVTDAAEFSAAAARADGDNLAVGDKLAVLAEDGTTIKVYTITVIILPVFNNDKIRIGNGNDPSVNSKGNLLQPFYYDTLLTNWYKLTYSSNPLDNAIGVGGDGTNEWNSAGTIAANPNLSNQVIDVSGYISTDANKGYGTIVSAGDVSIGGKTLEVKNTYTLGQDKSFIKIVSRIINKSGSEVTNLRFWVGTQDDWVGTSDSPTKKRGNLVNGQFAAIENAADQASALQISSAATGVLFYSTSEKAHTAVADGLGFDTAYGQNPATAPIELEGDSSYALYVRMNDLADEEYEEFTWYYAAGELANLGSVAEEVAEDSGPIATVPDAPTAVSAIAGNGQATVSFTPPASDGGSAITGYTVHVYQGGVLQGGLSTTGASSSIAVSGLTNGTAYTFKVIATNAVGDSAESTESDAVIPKTVPDAPTEVTATAGNGQATVSFTAPVNNGGTEITSYTVTSNPGNITATGASSPITVTGLTNGTAYTFTVVATNAVGNSTASTASSAVTPHAPSSDGSNSSTTQPPANTGVDILVNGKTENAGTATTTTEGNQTVTTITVDSQKLEQKLEAEGNNAVVTIPVNTKSDVVIGELNGQMVKNMENKQAVLEVKTENATYTLPAQQINISAISDQVGSSVELKDIKVQIEISKATAETAQVVENSAKKGEFSIVAPPVEFNVKCTYGNKTVEVVNFNAYVERTIAIPDGVDPSKITTGIIVDPDGTSRHVPTRVTVINGKYYAVINSLTNSLYSVVWHPLEFKDAEKHWAKEAINDMGSRMVISGIGNDMFEPDRDITRAEFAAIIVRALGLKPGTGTNSFTDVKASDWYSDYIKTAYEYTIISGYSADKFGPTDKITREQAMTMIARAMKITGLKAELANGEAEKLLAGFGDAVKSADYAKNSIAASVKAGIVSGRNGKMIAPKDNITRAEVAVTVRRLLQKSNLI